MKTVLETAMVTGNRSVPLRDKLLCPQSLTLEYTSYKLYWADLCAYQIEAMNMKTLDHSIAVHSQSHFPRFIRGIVHFYDSLYWTEVSSIFFLNETRGDRVFKLYDSRESLAGIQIVDPSRQPTGLKTVASKTKRKISRLYGSWQMLKNTLNLHVTAICKYA